MKIATASVALAAVLMAAQPAAAADMLYRYKPTQLSTLRGFNHQPYWALLAECAGIYGSLTNRLQDQGDPRADAAKAQGVAFFNLANARLTQDRGLTSEQARPLLVERVDAGRASGMQMLSEPPYDRTVNNEQVIDLFCSQVHGAYKSALRFR